MALNSHGYVNMMGDTQMKLSQLLTGAAVAALTAGASFAQVTTDIDTTINASTFNPGASIELVPELDFEAADLTAELNIAILPNDTNEFDVYAATAAQLTITLDGFEFSSNIAGGSFVTNWDANAAGADDCAFTVVSGGAAGDSSVTFETADLSLCDEAAGGDADDIGFVLPVTLTGLPATYSFELRQKANNALIGEGEFDVDGDANTPSELVVEAGGFEVDFNGNTLTAELADPSYNTLDANDAVSIDFNADGDIDLDGNPADWEDANQVEGLEVTVTLSNPTGIESVTLEDNNGNTLTEDLVNGAAVFTVDGSEIDLTNLTSGLVVSVNEDNDDETLIGNGTISVTVATDEATGANLDIADASAAEADEGEIVREGTTTAVFEWVGDATKTTANIWRITGLGDELPVIRATLSNSTNDMDDEYTITPSQPLSNGELILTSGDIGAVVGEFGRADVELSFEANGIVARRFMVTNGVVTENSTDYNVGGADIEGDE